MGIVIQDCILFDGRGHPGRSASVRIKGSKVVEISKRRLTPASDDEVVEADGKWVMPGFIDIHTHYDAEMELNPSLSESLRHGVTTVFIGSCSLSSAIGEPSDIADMFTRVEAIPYKTLSTLMNERKTWNSHREFAEHIEQLPLGPNVASFVGYSAVRASVLGLERALDRSVCPSEAELSKIEAIVDEGYDQGFLGLSMNTLYWDKMGGERFRSKCLPSTYASWFEISRMIARLRARELNFQVVPNISTKYELFVYAYYSMGFGLRKSLKTSLVSIMDIRSSRSLWRLLLWVGRMINGVFGGKFRFQLLPVAFDLWADGFENVVFEEFGAGAEGLHEASIEQRTALLSDPSYRQRFRQHWKNPISPRVFHRNFGKATVMNCPDRSVIGKTFREIGLMRGISEVDAFLDLTCSYGDKLRWYTVVGNDRAQPLAALMRAQESIIGFSDAGAHLRNMAFYNFPLRMLKFVKDRLGTAQEVMPLETAVWRLTGELAEWFDVDAGILEVGRRADVLLVDPEALDHQVEEIHEAPMPEFGGMTRLVRRNPLAVPLVLVNGQKVVKEGQVLSDAPNTGCFLRAGTFPKPLSPS